MPLIDPYDHDDSTPPPPLLPFGFYRGFATGMLFTTIICIILLT